MRQIKHIFLILAITFLVAFPKGGIKISDIPVTWSYIILIIAVPFNLLLINNNKIYFTKERRIALALCLPFIIYACIILPFGYIETVGFLFSFTLNLLIMPFLFLLLFSKIFDSARFENVFNKAFVACIRFVTVFGLVIFVQKIVTGSNIEIPYLTVNIDDVGHLDEKFNLRNGIMKYTSTYNNGNIFGVCMLILAPLYLQLEKKFTMKLTFFIALALTLSRTAWIGIIIYSLLIFTKNLKSIKGWSILILTIICTILSIPLLLNLINVDVDFLFDKNLGGRVEQLNVLDNISLFGSGHFDGIREIVYTSILGTFGIIGLVLFLVYISSSLIVLFFYRKKYQNKTNVHLGLILYPILCLSDGAMLYIPVMSFFWFISSYSLKYKNTEALNSKTSKLLISELTTSA